METKETIDSIIRNIEKVLVGKREVVEDVVLTLLAGGHMLLEDKPGVGKTTLAKALAASIECDFKRISFTPDTLPSDITGVSVYDRKSEQFVYSPGAVMSQIILADEINRTSPKTQASLLEAMEEGQVTVDGVTYPLKTPFMVIATQNPMDYLGTYQLPEAQLDRFLMKRSIGYPSEVDENRMAEQFLARKTKLELSAVTTAKEVERLQKEVFTVAISKELTSYVVELINQTRNSDYISLGASPRATLMLLRASQAKALMEGRCYVIPDDIKTLVPKVLSHRIQLSSEAHLKELQVEDILKQILSKTVVPVTRR